MATQTTYNSTQRAAVAGQQADMSPAVIISRNVEDAAGIGFGVVVGQGTRDKGCTATLTDMTATDILGVTLIDRSVGAESAKFPQYESARIMNKGTVWVVADGAVTAGDDVTVTLASGKLGTKAVAAGIIAIPGARWETSAADGALAIVRLG